MFSSFTLETTMLLKLMGFHGETPSLLVINYVGPEEVTICNGALAPIEMFVPATKLAQVLYE